jgi:hypothetical protein
MEQLRSCTLPAAFTVYEGADDFLNVFNHPNSGDHFSALCLLRAS